MSAPPSSWPWPTVASSTAMEGMDGAGRLSVRTARSDRVLVGIGDNGPGIPEPAHILEPFFTTKPVGKGTASGSTSAGGSVVQRHHGDPRITSTPATPVSRCCCLFIQNG